MKAGETDTMKTLIKHRKVTTIQQIVPKANNDVCTIRFIEALFLTVKKEK